MGLFRRNGPFSGIKKCPRCGLKMYEGAQECSDCGLIFSRLEIATNKEAKAKKLRNDRDFIINTSKLPSDVSFLKLLLLSIFLGPFGAHCFYVGRYLRGSILLTDMIAIIMFVVFNPQLVAIEDGKLITALATISGAIMLIWFLDIFLIITKKFKVPVAIDIEGQILKEKNDYINSLEQIKESQDGKESEEKEGKE